MMNIASIFNFFIPSAYAETTSAAVPPPPTGGGMSIMIMFAVFIVFMYFAVWRPQSKRAKEMRNLLSSLAKGDEVITSGGLVGRIAKVTDQYIVLAVSDNTEMVVQKGAIVGVLPKGTMKGI